MHRYRVVLIGGLFAALTGVVFYLTLFKESVPVGIVVPHHDMVASARQAYLKKISSQIKPRTIVVLVPDHFNQSTKPLLTTSQSWQTIEGEIVADQALIDTLALPKADEPFHFEHGLTVLLKDIKTYFSDAMIVPVMFSRNATFSEVAQFVQELNTACSECFVMASVDFSHTNTANGADLHDELVLRELHQVDAESLYKKAEVDSPEALSALAMWAQLHGAKQFTVFSHTNSGYLTNIPVGEMTTHIIGGYQKGSLDKQYDDQITFMMGGDVMFARSVYEEYRDSLTSPLAQLGERFFWGVDIALVNNEGVFSEGEQLQEGWSDIPPKLRSAPDAAGFYKMARINVAGLANNHTFDGGTIDADFSKTLLQQQGVSVIGYPRATSSVFIKEEGRTKLALVGIATHEAVSDIAESVRIYSEKGYQVVAYVHWGDEYMLKHSLEQEQMAQRLIDAGADLVVGSHPHVVQDVGVYKGVPIVYSLGNLIFDQDFRLETQIGAVLGAKISPEEIELFFIPVSSFQKSFVLPTMQYRLYQDEWTKGWAEYHQEFDKFVFPISPTL